MSRTHPESLDFNSFDLPVAVDVVVRQEPDEEDEEEDDGKEDNDDDGNDDGYSE